MRERRAALSAALAAVGVLMVGCGGSDPAPLVKSVYVTTAEPIAGGAQKSYTGVVEEAHEISLGFKTAGQLTRLHASEGDYVHQGQLLAELDDADYKLGVDAVQIQYDQLKDEVARTAQLYQEKGVSANDYEKAVAGLGQLGVQLKVNKNKLEYTKLYAPTDGYVRAVNFSPAEMVDAGTCVFKLLDISNLEVTADIPAADYQRRDNFISYEVLTPFDGTRMKMRLLGLTPKADGNQLFRLRLGFEGKVDSRVTAGMNVDVNIGERDTERGGHRVPMTALFEVGGKRGVWIVGVDSTVHRKEVDVLAMLGEGDVAVAGLADSLDVVRAGVHALQEGEKVRILPEPTATNIGGLL